MSNLTPKKAPVLINANAILRRAARIVYGDTTTQEIRSVEAKAICEALVEAINEHQINRKT